MFHSTADATRIRVRDTLRQSGGGRNSAILLRVARHESQFQPTAKSERSSASGVFQFTEQTWLHMVKSHGCKHGLARQAAAIRVLPGGRYEVPNADMRRAILAGRNDARLATQMAVELANENRAYLAKRLGRQASDGEVYAAHAFGVHGALKLIRARAANPRRAAAEVLPTAARANPSLFYDRGAPRSARSVLALLDGMVSHPRRQVGDDAGELGLVLGIVDPTNVA